MIRAKVLTISTVPRKRCGSCWSRCRVAARALPSSARWRTRRRLTEVSAVSVPEASAAKKTQAMRMISSTQFWGLN